MSIQSRLLEDMKKLMKSRDKESLSVIRMTRAAIKNVEIEKCKELDEAEVIDVLSREVRMRRDAIAEYERLQKDQEVLKLERELKILQVYLPEPLTDDEIRLLIQETIQSQKAVGKKDLGPVMGAVMPRVKGRAEGQAVRRMAMELLEV